MPKHIQMQINIKPIILTRECPASKGIIPIITNMPTDIVKISVINPIDVPYKSGFIIISLS